MLRRTSVKKNDTPFPEQEESGIAYFPLNVFPSKGITYPEGISFSYRRYGWLEMKVLSQRRDNMSLKTQADLVLRGIKCSDPSFNLMDLTVPDYLFFGLTRKVATLSPPAFDVRYECSACKKLSSFSVLVSELKFQDMEAPHGTAEVTLEGFKGEFQPVTIGRLIKSSDFDLEFPEWEEELLWASGCVSHPIEEIFEYLRDSATPDDAQILQKMDAMFYHGLELVHNVCRNTIVEVLNQEEYDRLRSRTTDELVKETREEEFRIRHNHVEIDLETYMERKGIITRKKCGHQTDLSLDGGEGLILPFRARGRDYADAVSYRDSREPVGD